MDRRHLNEAQRQELLGLIAEAGVPAVIEALATYVARYAHSARAGAMLRKLAEELR